MNEVVVSQDEIIEEFSLLDNWVDRYQYIIDMGRNLSWILNQKIF